MTATITTDTCRAPESPALRPFMKVALIWALLGGIFAAFNVMYWPAYRQRTIKHPESFIEYAALLPRDEARSVLQTGIARFNPPHEQPYLMLAALEKEAGENRDGSAEFLERRAHFYTLLRNAPLSESEWASLTRHAAEAYASIRLSSDMQAGVSLAAASLEAALGIGESANTWTTQQYVGLFVLGGGGLSLDGRIGSTDVRTPVPLLVYSGGGSDERRGAHIVVGAADHAARQRGMHIVLLNEKTGAVLRADLFDLWEDTFEAERMLHFLNNAPDGCIGLFAVCDDGSAFMTSTIEEGLMQFGIGRRTYVGRDAKILGLRYSFAAIGVKGAPGDTALQCWSPEWFKGRRGHPVVCAVSMPGDVP